MGSWVDAITGGATAAGDTAFDVAFSGHKHDEIDILGSSATLPTGQANPDTTTWEDEIPVHDPESGEFLGYTNTDSLPVGGDDSGETPDSAGGGSTAAFYLVALLFVVYILGQLIDVNLGGG